MRKRSQAKRILKLFPKPDERSELFNGAMVKRPYRIGDKVYVTDGNVLVAIPGRYVKEPYYLMPGIEEELREAFYLGSECFKSFGYFLREDLETALEKHVYAPWADAHISFNGVSVLHKIMALVDKVAKILEVDILHVYHHEDDDTLRFVFGGVTVTTWAVPETPDSVPVTLQSLQEARERLLDYRWIKEEEMDK